MYVTYTQVGRGVPRVAKCAFPRHFDYSKLTALGKVKYELLSPLMA
jgi:hypothetical protein